LFDTRTGQLRSKAEANYYCAGDEREQKVERIVEIRRERL
jgi:hypothetical protein